MFELNKELTVKQLRDQREFETIFKNPRSARAQWAQNIVDRYAKPALEPIQICDKDGNLTPTSQIELAVWRHLCAELRAQGSDRLPTEGEMMDACQQYYARHNSSAYVARRDSMGAKPVDETRQQVSVNNPLEDLSDEELLVMQRALEEHRQKMEAKANERITNDAIGDKNAIEVDCDK
jgi:hypothetical protein